MKKISIILILALFIVTIRVDYVKADTITEHWVDNFNLAKDNVNAFYDFMANVFGSGSSLTPQASEKLKNAVSKALCPIGFIVGYATFSEQNFVDFFNGKNYGGIQLGGESGTNEQVYKDTADLLYEHIEFTQNNEMIIDSSAMQFLKDYVDFIKDQSGFRYCYSYDIVLHATQFGSGDVFSALRNVCNEYQDNYIIGYYPSYNEIYLISSNNVDGVKSGSFDVQDVGVNWYDRTSWNMKNIDLRGVYNNGQFSISSYSGNSNIAFRCSSTYDHVGNLPSPCVITAGKRNTYKVFATLTDLKGQSVGQSPYYESPNWQNFVNSNNTYTVDSSNSNNITYGDIITYNNNYYNENGEYPNPSTINVYITNNIPPSSGGGSGGDNGGGSGGGSDSGSSIWDFLSRLGEVLSGLISNLGNMLTSLIESIVTIINDVIGKIPQVFNGLLEVVFGGLPEDMRAIIILGITVMVVYGIIKVIRG